MSHALEDVVVEVADEILRLRSLLSETVEALEACLDSLEYVQRLGEVSGYGVRSERIAQARDAIAKAKGM